MNLIKKSPASPMQALENGFSQAMSIFEANKDLVNTDESLKPEYSLLKKVAEGVLDPYKFFPYRGGRVYETRQRWSEYFIKYYKEAFHEQALNTLRKGGLTDPFVLQNLAKKHVPLPFNKGEGGVFFLRVLANCLYPYLNFPIELESKETKYDWLEPAKIWHKRWFEGFFNDPAVAKVKVDVLFEFVSENLPFRIYKNCLREYIKARGAMSHEEFLALEEQEEKDTLYAYDFAFLIHNLRTLKPAIEKKVAVEKKSSEHDKETLAKLDEVIAGYEKRVADFAISRIDSAKLIHKHPVMQCIIEYAGLVLKEVLKQTTAEENQPLLDKVLESLKEELVKYKDDPTEVLDLLQESKDKHAHLYDLMTFKPNAPEALISVVSASLPLEEKDVEAHKKRVANAKAKKPQPILAQVEEQKEEEPMATTPQPTPQVEVIDTPTTIDTPKEQSYFVSNGIKLGLLDGSSGSITINKTFIIGKTLPPSDMTLHVKALDCLVLSRP